MFYIFSASIDEDIEDRISKAKTCMDSSGNLKKAFKAYLIETLERFEAMLTEEKAERAKRVQMGERSFLSNFYLLT